MNLSSRSAAHEDFASFFDACYHDAQLDQSLRHAVEHEWHLLLDSQAAISLVVEDLSRPQHKRLVGCAQLAFVTRRFIKMVRAIQEPWVNARLDRLLPDGSSPLLAPDQIARANAASGLSALFTRWHRADRLLGPEEMLETNLFMLDSFQSYCRGYRFREMLIEATGEAARDQGLRAGFRQVCDYAEYYREHPPLPPPARRPFLMGVAREEALTTDGCVMSYYFVHRSPRFRLTASQQALLGLSLRQPNLSDVALAAELGVPVHRVKNLLRAVYRQISEVHFDLLPEMGEGSRGLEKKQRLLLYLRDHPEELRPYQLAQKLGSGVARPELKEAAEVKKG